MQFSLFPPCRHVVLDEADQMLERGFAESVEEILAASFSESKNTKLMYMYTLRVLMIKLSLVPLLLNILPVLSFERHLVVMLWATVTGFAGISVTLGL